MIPLTDNQSDIVFDGSSSQVNEGIETCYFSSYGNPGRPRFKLPLLWKSHSVMAPMLRFTTGKLKFLRINKTLV